MVSPARHPRGQQRDKLYREALRLELADMNEGVDLKKLREIARAHIEMAAAGDLHAIKELRDTLDGKPAQMVEAAGPETPITEIVHKYVHVSKPPPELEGEEPPLIDWHEIKPGNGSNGGAR